MTAAQPKPEAQAAQKKKRRRHSGPRIDGGGGRDARRTAMLILEVLGGARTPAQAAQALGVSTTRYYGIESRALGALVAACEPRGRGPRKSADKQIAALQRKVEGLERECARRQSLLRLSQRTLGVSPSKPAKKKPGAKRRPKRATVRALRAAAQLGLPEGDGDVTES